MIPIAKQATTAFMDYHGEFPEWVIAAPGRVNLIGEHTDYNDGFVLPMAIDRWISIALKPRKDGVVSLRSLDFREDREFELSSLSMARHSWVEYAKGVAWALMEAKYALKGFDAVIAGDIPLSAGLSSSAALEMVIAYAFAQASGFTWEAVPMALVGQRAENDWVGMNCGIMDQFISTQGQSDHALFIDCRSLESRAIPLPSSLSVVVLDTRTPRGLIDSAYNSRREECVAAAERLGVSHLRDVSLAHFEAQADTLPPRMRKRVRHVVSENARVLSAIEAMENNDAFTLGELMQASHQSLRDDYQVSSPALDLMADIANQAVGCFGARMTGGGFGGSCVALVHTPELNDFTAEVSRRYAAESNRTPRIYPCRAVRGAALEPIR